MTRPRLLGGAVARGLVLSGVLVETAEATGSPPFLGTKWLPNAVLRREEREGNYILPVAIEPPLAGSVTIIAKHQSNSVDYSWATLGWVYPILVALFQHLSR